MRLTLCDGTLRLMARPGWSAKALLQPLWRQYPGGRDALADAVGTTGASLSSRNSGRLTLGHDLAERLAAELSRGLNREVSVLELGAPAAEADEAGQSILDRLEELAGAVKKLSKQQEDLALHIAALELQRDGTLTQSQPTSRRRRKTA